MKKGYVLIAVLLAAALLLTGCKASFVISGTGTKSTIDVKNAENDAYGESSVMSVGNGRVAVVESALDKGKLQIDFVEVAVFHHDDEPDETMTLDTVASVTVGPGEKTEVEIPSGDYVLQVTTVGQTNGKVTVEFVKK